MKYAHPRAAVIQALRNRTRDYLTGSLLPFWIERSPDTEFGGFLTYFDRKGQRTGQTEKTLLMQIRMLFTMSSAHRAGYGNGRCAELAHMAARFILDHYWDEVNGGWIWIADRNGNPIVSEKVGYGQCFALYAFSEYYLATQDTEGLDAAERTWNVIAARMADPVHGGFYEMMHADWTPLPGNRSGGDRKSFDVHMHMMEALTTFHEATRSTASRNALLESIETIRSHMIEPDTGTPWMQFSLDFTPLPAIIFEMRWGRDADPTDGVARPLDTTSYGHNVEFVWLLLHAYDIMGVPLAEAIPLIQPMLAHSVANGIDWEYGGIFVEGQMEGSATDQEKQFWQQAEVLVGMLDAYALFKDPIYWAAFENVYDFTFRACIVKEVGEWYERLDRTGTPIDDALGHAWKISYHTVRSMIQTVNRLNSLLAPGRRHSAPGTES